MNNFFLRYPFVLSVPQIISKRLSAIREGFADAAVPHQRSSFIQETVGSRFVF